MGTRSIDGDLFVATPTVGLSVVKSAARTREAHGLVTAVNCYVELLNPLSQRVVSAKGLIEILFEHAEIGAGDSGSLVCVEDGPRLRPFAMIVGGAMVAPLAESKKKRSAIAYAIPLMAIPSISGMELA